MPTVVDPGGSFAVCRAIVRVRGTGIAPGIWHVGMFVNGTQVTHRAFENKDWVTYELALVTINRGDTVDVRVYALPGQAVNPAQICEWRLENMCVNGCDPYSGGPLEGAALLQMQEPCDACGAIEEAMEFASSYDGGGDFSDPSLWAAGQDIGDPVQPPWEANVSDPWDPGPGADLRFEPLPP